MVKYSSYKLKFPNKDIKVVYYNINAYLEKEGGLGEATSAIASYLCYLYYNYKYGPSLGKSFRT